MQGEDLDFLRALSIYIYIYIFIYVCMYVCVCVTLMTNPNKDVEIQEIQLHGDTHVLTRPVLMEFFYSQ